MTLVAPDAAPSWPIRRSRWSETTETPEARAAAAPAEPRERWSRFLARASAPAVNWLDATVPFLANPRIAAVVSPSLAPATGSLRERGGGRAPGVLARRRLALLPLHARQPALRQALSRLEPRRSARLPPRARRADLHPDRIVAALTGRGRFVLYTPETVVVAPRPPLFRPHLSRVAALGRARGRAISGARAPRAERRGTPAARSSRLPPRRLDARCCWAAHRLVAWASSGRCTSDRVAQRASRRASLPIAPVLLRSHS